MANPFSIVCESVGGSLTRKGKLNVPNRKTIETPAILMHTNAGAVPHLTKDVVQSMIGGNKLFFNMSLGHFIKFPGTHGLKEMKQNIQEFTSIEELQFPTYLSVQDPLKPIPHHFNDTHTVSVWDCSGRRRINVSDFAEFVKQAVPDMFESLSDTVQCPVSTKRIDKSISRSIDHLDGLINILGTDSKNKLFACLEGGDLLERRVTMAKTISQRAVAGFAINGVTDDSSDVILLADLLKRVHTELPVDKPRMLHSVGSPRMVLSAVDNGTDLFDGSYLSRLKDKNIAINIPFENSHHQDTTEHSQIDNIMIDVTSEEFKDYLRPLNSKCLCYTCSNYTCAYLHHLFVTKEMLLPMLIMIHNINQYQRFFADIREQITQQTFEKYRKKLDILCRSNPINF